ncbi:hypothetical protein [Haloferula sp.]|uniref:hypothetical protein n=1 Tax=Haloferula sp. TaxID=2497595 RepID=UPI003C78F5BA
MKPYITITNIGPEIESTNFWDTEIGTQNHAFSVNAGCLRLLVPNCHTPCLPDMVGCEYVVASIIKRIQPKKFAIELLFEDHTQTPFSIHMCPGACLSLFPLAENSKVATDYEHGNCASAARVARANTTSSPTPTNSKEAGASA